jgi:hypothetical protein
VGLASPTVRGEEYSTDLQSDAAAGSGTAMGLGTTTGTPPVASKPKVGSGMGLATATARREGRRRGRGQGWRRQRRGVEGGGGGTEGGCVDGVASRDAAAYRVGKLGSLTVQNQISPRLEFHVCRVTPLIHDTLLISTEIVQSISKM